MKLLNSNKFFLNGTKNRYSHLATIGDGLKEYMCFIDNKTMKVYIEQITGGHLEFINDDQLANELASFLADKGITKITYEDQKTSYRI
jgi:hypothetical protein